MKNSPGTAFRRAVADNLPLQVVGTVNAYTAMMAERIGHKALYLSGAGCANMSYGLPDLALTSLNDVLEDVRRITAAVTTPLLVDIDTGWGGALNIARTIQLMERAGVGAVHIEDQVSQKRCGHRPNKAIVSEQEMLDRIKAACDARDDENFFIMARTDAYALEGLSAAIDRASACVEAGADGVFAEAMPSLDAYRAFKAKIQEPLLANMTEFGQTPLFHTHELYDAGVAMVLYPLSAARAMNKAAEQVYQSLLHNGDQKACVHTMQTREELYRYLDYYQYEQKLDELFSQDKNL